VTDFHVITPESAELVMQVIDGELVIVPPSRDTEHGAAQDQLGSAHLTAPPG
jgi:hypothetical protein